MLQDNIFVFARWVVFAADAFNSQPRGCEVQQQGVIEVRCFKIRANNRKMNVFNGANRLTLRLSPIPDRAPWAQWGSTPLQLILPLCIRAAAAAGSISLRGSRILQETFRQNFGSATRMLRRKRKWSARRCCRRWS